MDARDVKILIDKSIILFDEEHEKFPGVIKHFNLTESGKEKPYTMTALISETEAGKGKVLNDWTFEIDEDDIYTLKEGKQTTLNRVVNMGGSNIVIEYRGIVLL